MASKSDILLKYKNAYSDYESKSKDRLKALKRSFSNEKQLYEEDILQLDNQLHIEQNQIYDQMMTLHDDYETHMKDIIHHFENLKIEFNEDIYQEMSTLDQQIIEEANTYDDILEEFEQRKQDALDMYLKLTKENNAAIDSEMQIHRDFIMNEQQKLMKYKSSYDDLSAELSNKMMWTIEKSKNAIEILHNKLDELNKDDLFSLNQQILKALTDLRGTRNDINVIFKETSNRLNNYKDEIYKLRKAKQKPYSSINHQLIQKLIKQIRIANHNKVKYQAIINKDLNDSLKKLYPHILIAYKDHQNDALEKYIIQTEILQKKAEFLNKKIEKITNYNISTYQKRIKDIKIETFTRNEEIKFSYSVPMKFVENAINIYSNYNFYFNQGFNDLDTLLSGLISFSQNFNEIRNTESLQVKDDLTAYQNNYLATISEVSKQLSDLLYHIDEVAVQISTLESENRLDIAEIKKEMINVDIKGDYKKYLESLETDFQIAKKEYKNRLKTINVKKMYHDQTLELYQSAIHLDQEKELLIVNRAYQSSLSDLETTTHQSYYDYLKTQYNIFYSHQINMLESFMKIIKERLTQSLKASNYQLAKGYFNHEDSLKNDSKELEIAYKDLETRLQSVLDMNDLETNTFVNYLTTKGKENSTINHLEKLRIELNQQLSKNHKQKTKSLSQTVLDAYQDYHHLKATTKERLITLTTHTKELLFLIDKDTSYTDHVANQLKHNYQHLYVITSIYYDITSLIYQNHHLGDHDALNNFYDDITFKLIEDAVKLFDQYDRTNKPKKKHKRLKKYLVNLVDAFTRVESFYNKVIDHTHEQYIQTYLKQLALIEIDHDHQKEMVDDYFDSFAKKSLKNHQQIDQQKAVILDMTHQFRQWIEKQIDDTHEQFIEKSEKHDFEIAYVKKQVTKMIKQSDKQLKKINKEINQLFMKQYRDMDADYQSQIQLIDELKDQLANDHDVEKQYINYIIDQALSDINQTKQRIHQKMSKIPTERHQRLHDINISRHHIFNQHQAILHDQLADIERDKFTTVPQLENKIQRLQNQVKIKFEQLYHKHQSLEEHYLDKYTQTNQTFISLHQGFQKDLIDSKLHYDDVLNQPLKDLLSTETSVIEKVDTIHHEVSSKTDHKIKEIHDNKKASKNKQDRIIHS